MSTEVSKKRLKKGLVHEKAGGRGGPAGRKIEGKTSSCAKTVPRGGMLAPRRATWPAAPSPGPSLEPSKLLGTK